MAVFLWWCGGVSWFTCKDFSYITSRLGCFQLYNFSLFHGVVFVVVFVWWSLCQQQQQQQQLTPRHLSPFHPFHSPTSLYHFSTRFLLPKFCVSGKLLTCGVIRSYNLLIFPRSKGHSLVMRVGILQNEQRCQCTTTPGECRVGFIFDIFVLTDMS